MTATLTTDERDTVLAMMQATDAHLRGLRDGIADLQALMAEKAAAASSRIAQMQAEIDALRTRLEGRA